MNENGIPGRKYALLRKKLIGAGLSEQSADVAIRIFDAHLDQDVEMAAIARPVLYSFGYSEESATIHWEQVKRDVLERDNYVCFYCKADVTEDPTVDHIQPSSKKGGIEPTNLITACRSCNSSKGARDVHDWLASRP